MESTRYAVRDDEPLGPRIELGSGKGTIKTCAIYSTASIIEWERTKHLGRPFAYMDDSELKWFADGWHLPLDELTEIRELEKSYRASHTREEIAGRHLKRGMPKNWRN